MKILLINHYAGSNRHGMEFRPYYLAKEWVQQGHAVTILAGTYSHVRKEQPKITGAFREEYIDGIRYIWLKTPVYEGNGLKRFLSMLCFVSSLYRYQYFYLRDFKPEAVIASSTYPLDIYPAHSIARKSGAKLFFELHDLWPLSPMELGGMSRWHPFILLMQHAENYFCRHVDKVISILPKTLVHLQSHGLRKEKFVFVPNGIVPETWRLQATPLSQEHQNVIQELKNKDHFIVGYAGAHGLANALDSLLDAAKQTQNKPVSYVFVGQGPEKVRLKKRIQEEKINNVYLLPSIAKESIPSFLQQMDALYVGLKKEPLFRYGISPNKLMDYMMASKPVIHAIEAGNNLVEEAGCGISVKSESPEEITGAVNKLMTLSAEERCEMGNKGNRYVLLHHDYKVLAQKFLDALL